MLEHLKQQGAFTVKMGPPVIIRRWDATTIKAAHRRPGRQAAAATSRPTFIEPRAFEVADRLRRMGWQQGEDGGAGFGDVQPRYVYQVPLENRSLDDILKGFNQLWRRNIKKAEKAGVQVVQGGYDDLPVWHAALRESPPSATTSGRARCRTSSACGTRSTARTPTGCGCTWPCTRARRSPPPRCSPSARHVWYSYGASANHKREVRPSNAMQWRMLRDAYAMGASVYDLRGISDSLDETTTCSA